VTVHRMIDTARRSEVNVTVVKRNRGAQSSQDSLERALGFLNNGHAFSDELLVL